jgi:hypothetical protein
MEIEALAKWLPQALVQSGVAKLDGTCLIDQA